jgi:hypothetical protein
MAVFPGALVEADVSALEPDSDILVNYGLVVRLALRFHEATKVLGLHGELGMAGKSGWTRISGIEPLEPLVPFVGRQHGERTLGFRGVFAPAVLEAIEGFRGDSDLQLIVRAWLVWERDGDTNRSDVKLSYRVPMSDWVRIVHGMGAHRTLMFAVGMPHESRMPPELVRVLVDLDNARDELSAGRRAREVAKFVRQALEGITHWQGDAEDLKRLGGQPIGALREKELAERLQLVRLTLKWLVDPGAHGGAQAELATYEIPIAKAALAMAVAVLSAYVEA